MLTTAETTRWNPDLLGCHGTGARIDHFRLHGKASETPVPVPLFDDEADVHFITGPINAALGENESIQVFRQYLRDAINVEAREIQHAIVARIRNEADVITQPR